MVAIFSGDSTLSDSSKSSSFPNLCYESRTLFATRFTGNIAFAFKLPDWICWALRLCLLQKHHLSLVLHLFQLGNVL